MSFIPPLSPTSTLYRQRNSAFDNQAPEREGQEAPPHLPPQSVRRPAVRRQGRRSHASPPAGWQGRSHWVGGGTGGPGAALLPPSFEAGVGQRQHRRDAQRWESNSQLPGRVSAMARRLMVGGCLGDSASAAAAMISEQLHVHPEALSTRTARRAAAHERIDMSGRPGTVRSDRPDPIMGRDLSVGASPTRHRCVNSR